MKILFKRIHTFFLLCFVLLIQIVFSFTLLPKFYRNGFKNPYFQSGQRNWTERRYLSDIIEDSLSTDRASPDLFVNYKAVQEPYNVLCTNETPVHSDTHYWKYYFSEVYDRVFVGVSDESVESGKPINCLCYGGDLSDGSTIIVSDFGPKIKSGDTVGMLVSYNNDRIQVYFDINGDFIGLAFDVPASTLPYARPVIQFYKSGTVRCEKRMLLPPAREQEKPLYSGIEGPWVLSTLERRISIGTVVQYSRSTTRRATLEIVLVGDELTIHAHSVENRSFRFLQHQGRWVPYFSSNICTYADQKLTFDNVLFDILANPDTQNQIGSMLIITRGIWTSKWTRYYDLPEPYVANPFI